MRRNWIEEPTEEEISAEETQEYRVPGTDDEFEAETEAGFEELVEDDEDFIYEDETGEEEFFEDEEPQETEAEKTDRVAEARERAAQAGEKLKVGWAAAVGRARKVELPGRPEKIDSTLALSIAAIALIALVVGVGAFFVGKGSGDSVDQARLEGGAAGARAGAIRGASGYGEAFKVARESAFEKAYVPAYRKNFKKAFENEGLEVPAAKDIPVPEP